MESLGTLNEGDHQPEAPTECDPQAEEEPCPPVDNGGDYITLATEDPAPECPPQESPAEYDDAPSVEDTQPEIPPEEEPCANDPPDAEDSVPPEDVSAESNPIEALEPTFEDGIQPDDDAAQEPRIEDDAPEDIASEEGIQPDDDAAQEYLPQEEPRMEDDAPEDSDPLQPDPDESVPESPALPDATDDVADPVPEDCDPEYTRPSEEDDSGQPEPPYENMGLVTEDVVMEESSNAQLEPTVAGDMDLEVPSSGSFDPQDGVATEAPLQEDRALELELEYMDDNHADAGRGDLFLSSVAPPPPPKPLRNNSTAQIITQRADQADLLPTAPPTPPPKPKNYLTLTYGWGDVSEDQQHAITTHEHRPAARNESNPTVEPKDARTDMLQDSDDPASPEISNQPLPHEQRQTPQRRTQGNRSSAGNASTSRQEPARGSSSASRTTHEGPASTTRRAGSSASTKGEQINRTQQSQISAAQNTSTPQPKPRTSIQSRTQVQRPLSTPSLNPANPVFTSSTRQEPHPVLTSTTEKTSNQKPGPKHTASAPKLRDTQIPVARPDVVISNPKAPNITHQKPEIRRNTPSPKIQDTNSAPARNVSFDTKAQQPEPKSSTLTPRVQDTHLMAIHDVATSSAANATHQEPEAKRARSITRIQDPRPLSASPEQTFKPQPIYHPDRRSQSPESRRNSTPMNYEHLPSSRGPEHRHSSQIYWADQPNTHGEPESSRSTPPVPSKAEETTPRPISYADPRLIPLNEATLRTPLYSSSMNAEGTSGGFPVREEKVSRKRTVGERIEPTLETAKMEKAKYTSKAKWTGIILNIAIALQVLLGSLTTGLSVATSGHRTQLLTAVFGGLSTLVASYLAKSRGSNEPELSIARTKDLEQFIRECESFKMDYGHENGEQHMELLLAYRRRFEDLGNGSGERRLSSVSSQISKV